MYSSLESTTWTVRYVGAKPIVCISYGLSDASSRCHKSCCLQIRFLHEQVARYNQGAADKLNLFGDNAKRLQYAIHKRARDFHFKPVGPVGFYLGLSDERYDIVGK